MLGKRILLKLTAKYRSLDSGIILTIYLILKPLYLFSSGLPQISDIFLMSAAVCIILRKRGKMRIPHIYSKWLGFFALTLLFQIIVQSLWLMRTGDTTMMLFAAYYIFNFVAAFLCIYIGNQTGIEKLKLAICKGCFYSILVTAAGFIVRRSSGIRTTGFFNNPNQLGYYALLVVTIIAFFPDQLPKWQNAAIVIVSILANVLSLSKASIIGFAGLTVSYILWSSKGKTTRRIVKQIILLLIVLGIVYWLFFSGSSIVSGNKTLFLLRSRILNMASENDSTLGLGRGYGRVWEMGPHILWGMGEGAFYRFSALKGLEIHSTYLNLLVSYGIIGFISYFWLLGRAVIKRALTIRNLACFSGIMLYGITHNGIRNTLLWILTATVLQIRESYRPGARNHLSAS